MPICAPFGAVDEGLQPVVITNAAIGDRRGVS